MTVGRRPWAGPAGSFAAALITAAVVGPAGTATAAPASACTPTSGAVVAVDFSHWGGGTGRGCDPRPTTGLNLLHNAGFSTVGTRLNPTAFVCRINNLPEAAAESCAVTPPASAYWSFWKAPAGQSGWSRSQLGVASDHPGPGEVEAWTFGAGASPPFAPAAGRATAPPPATTPRTAAPAPAPAPPPAPRPAPAPGRAGGSAGNGRPGGTPAPAPGDIATTASSPGPAATSRAHTSRGTGAPTGSTTGPSPSGPHSAASGSGAPGSAAGASPASSDVVVSPVARASAAGGGSPVPLAIAGGLAVVLLAGAGGYAWRRNRSG